MAILDFKDWIKKYKLAVIISIYPIIYFLLTKTFTPNISFISFKEIFKFGTLAFSLSFLLPKVSKRYAAYIVIYTTLISLFIALLQLIYPELGWSIRRFIDEDTFLKLNNTGARPSGLAYYTLTLSEQLLICTPFLLYFIERFQAKVYTKFIFVFIFILSCFSINNRGLSVGLIFIISFFYFRNIKKFFLLLIPIFIFFVTVITYLKGVRFLNFEEGNDTARIDALISSLFIIKDHFIFGIGKNYENVRELIVEYSKYSFKIFSPKFLGEIYPHNYFINTHLKFGILGTILNTYLYKDFFSLTTASKALIFALIFNSFFHNGGTLNSSTLLIGYFLAIITLNKKE